MREALAFARIAYAEQEVPIGAVVVREGRMVGRGRNRRERLADPPTTPRSRRSGRPPRGRDLAARRSDPLRHASSPARCAPAPRSMRASPGSSTAAPIPRPAIAARSATSREDAPAESPLRRRGRPPRGGVGRAAQAVLPGAPATNGIPPAVGSVARSAALAGREVRRRTEGSPVAGQSTLHLAAYFSSTLTDVTWSVFASLGNGFDLHVVALADPRRSWGCRPGGRSSPSRR